MLLSELIAESRAEWYLDTAGRHPGGKCGQRPTCISEQDFASWGHANESDAVEWRWRDTVLMERRSAVVGV